MDADRIRCCDHDNACDLDDIPTIEADNDLARNAVRDHDTDRGSHDSVPVSIGAAGTKYTSPTPPAVTLIQNVAPTAIQIETATATATWTATDSAALTATMPATVAFLPS